MPRPADFPTTIASDEDMQRECARYVNTRFAPTAAQERAAEPADRNGHNLIDHGLLLDDDDDEDIWPLSASGKKLDGVCIVQLFAALRHSLSVREWYTENSSALANIDLRRFITFGVIKGFVFRVHKYALLTGAGDGGAAANGFASQKSTSGRKTTGRVVTTKGPKRRTAIARSMSSELQVVADGDGRVRRAGSSDEDNSDDADVVSNERLKKYLDGAHCFDQICTALEISEKELLERIKRFPGEVLVIHR